MTRSPTLLYCVGATKAGTTWLYRFLSEHSDCHLRSVKEVHYFDALDHGDQDWQARHCAKRQAALRDRLALASASARAGIERQIGDYDALIGLHETRREDTEAYLDYLNGGRSDQALVADITPAYGLLSVQRLAQMAKLATNTRFIYILRDPVARLWSHIRMNAARRGGDAAQVQARANRIFWRLGRGRHPGIIERSDYSATLARLHQALVPAQLLVLFYEEMFSHLTMNRICAFLGIGQRAAQLDVPEHRGAVATMNDAQLQQARQWLAAQYEYVHASLGRVPAQWRANMPEVTT
jgi:Sulfotransferase family